jgi:hypothetical protein
MAQPKAIIPIGRIETLIYVIRGQRVMLDEDLARLYGVETRTLTRQVRRNTERFPADFMFVLEKQEVTSLRCQTGTAKSQGRGGRRTPPYAFTQEGVAMLSSVLRSKRAVEVNILIMRAFVKFRALLATHEQLARKLDALEKRYDKQFRVVFEAIRELMKTPEPKKRQIGFRSDRRP